LKIAVRAAKGDRQHAPARTAEFPPRRPGSGRPVPSETPWQCSGLPRSLRAATEPRDCSPSAAKAGRFVATFLDTPSASGPRRRRPEGKPVSSPSLTTDGRSGPVCPLHEPLVVPTANVSDREQASHAMRYLASSCRDDTSAARRLADDEALAVETDPHDFADPRTILMRSPARHRPPLPARLQGLECWICARQFSQSRLRYPRLGEPAAFASQPQSSRPLLQCRGKGAATVKQMAKAEADTGGAN